MKTFEEQITEHLNMFTGKLVTTEEVVITHHISDYMIFFVCRGKCYKALHKNDVIKKHSIKEDCK